MTVDNVYGKQFDDFFVGFEGSFGAKHVTPRSLSARFLGNLVCLEGIVTKCEYESIFLYTCTCTLFNSSSVNIFFYCFGSFRFSNTSQSH